MTEVRVTLPARLNIKINGELDPDNLIPVDRLPNIPATKITGSLAENQIPSDFLTAPEAGALFQPLIASGNAAAVRSALQVDEYPTLLAATKPLTRRDGSPLQIHDTWLDSTDHTRWFWNGTYWLSQQVRTYSAVAFVTATTTSGVLSTDEHNIFLMRLEMSIFFSAGNHDAANNYSVRLRRNAANSTATAIDASATTSALVTAATRPTYRTTINLHRDFIALSSAGYDFEFLKNGAAPNSTIGATLYYRLAKP